MAIAKSFKKEYKQGMRFITFLERRDTHRIVPTRTVSDDVLELLAEIAQLEKAEVGNSFAIMKSGALELLVKEAA